MMEQNPSDVNIPPQAPDAALDVPDAPAWPKPVGLVSVILGALHIGCIGCGAAAISMGVMFSEQMAQRFPDGVPPQVGSVSIPMMSSMAFGLVVQIVLITAGSMLLMRRAVARPLHLLYVGLAVISFVIGTIVQVQAQVEMTDWIKQNPDTEFAKQQQATGWIGQVIGWTFGILLGLCWPIFCGVWFGLIKKRGSDITAGRIETV